jgi:hypothetical protein
MRLTLMDPLYTFAPAPSSASTPHAIEIGQRHMLALRGEAIAMADNILVFPAAAPT